MRRVRHGFHPPRQHCERSIATVSIALDGLGCEHDGLHPRRADLIDGTAYDRLTKAGAQHGLSTRSLPDSRGKDVPKVGLRDLRLDVFPVDAG